MAEDLSSSSDPAATERPSTAARLIIMVGPDLPGGRKAGSTAPGGTRSAPQAEEPPEDADGLRA